MSSSLEELPAAHVAAADRIALKFQEQPALTGEYRIASDGTLSVPVIGRIDLKEMSLADLEQELTRRVIEISGRTTYVTAEIIAYQPIFVTGFVSKPGALEWHPGLTVLQAEALAGGLYRATESPIGDAKSGIVESRRLLLKSREQQKLLLASLARLKAERMGSTQIEIPPALMDLVGEDQARNAVKGQQSLLDGRRSELEKKKGALEQGIAIAAKELDLLNDLRNRLDEQLRMRRDQQTKIVGLLQKGFVPRERSLESEIEIAELEEKATDVAVARARLESTAARLRQDSSTIEQDRAMEIDAEIAKLESELAGAGIDMDAAMAAYTAAAQAAASPLPRTVIKYTIIRRNKGGENRLPAQTSSYLRPGDVLLVSQEIDDNVNPPKHSLNGGIAGAK